MTLGETSAQFHKSPKEAKRLCNNNGMRSLIYTLREEGQDSIWKYVLCTQTGASFSQ